MAKRFYNQNGNVAVLYSPGFGAGWYTWNTQYPDCLFNPELVELVIQRSQLEKGKAYDDLTQKIKDKATALYCDNGYDFYSGGARDLTVEWIPEGTPFDIHEYDGSESIEYGDRQWIIA